MCLRKIRCQPQRRLIVRDGVGSFSQAACNSCSQTSSSGGKETDASASGIMGAPSRGLCPLLAIKSLRNALLAKVKLESKGSLKVEGGLSDTTAFFRLTNVQY
jgi:hypothetical protein